MYSEEDQNNQAGNDPSNWFLGIFYFNKNDKRFLLPKRNLSLGFTVNFANPQAYLFIAVLMLLIGLLTRI